MVSVSNLLMRMKVRMLLFILLLVVAPFGVVLSEPTDTRTELHVAFITSFGGEFVSSESIPAVKLATDIINADEAILPGYKLVIDLLEYDEPPIVRKFTNSNCSRIKSQRVFLHQVMTGENKVAVIGCGCSLATESVAQISGFWNITQVSYSPSALHLSDREVFPNLWQIYPQESHLISPLTAVMKQFNWTKVKIITQDEDFFQQTSEILGYNLRATKILRSNDSKLINITVVREGITTFQTSGNVYNMAELFEPEVRIYVLNMYPRHARRIMCRAASSQSISPSPGFHYPGYVWIIPGWYKDNWWREEVARDLEISCSDQDLEQFILNTLSIQISNGTIDPFSPTDVNLTTTEFEDEYFKKAKMSGYYVEGPLSEIAYLAYDSVWTLALGINVSLPIFEKEGLLNAPFDYRENGSRFTKHITKMMSRLYFTGVSGEVHFNNQGIRQYTMTKIFKYRNTSITNTYEYRGPSSITRRLIATLNNSNIAFIESEDSSSVWPGGVPPDGTPMVMKTTVYLPLSIVYFVAVAIGITFAIVCLLFNCIFRKRKIIRLTSPNLNYIIIAGALLLYASVILFIFPSTDEFLVTFFCQLRSWTQGLGYFMSYGAIVAKMLRVYFIFRQPLRRIKKKLPLQDWHLMMIVVGLCSMDIIFFIFVAIFGDYKAELAKNKERPMSRNEMTNVLYDKQNFICKGPRDQYWINIHFAYIILTQLFSVFLAFRTRKVVIKALNDSKYVTIIIYLSTVTVTMMIIFTVKLDGLLNADGAVFGGLIYIFTTIILTILFIPKMVILYNDPDGKKIFSTSTKNFEQTVAMSDIELEKHCKELEDRLRKYEEVAPFKRSGRQLSIPVQMISPSDHSCKSTSTNLSFSLQENAKHNGITFGNEQSEVIS